LNSANFRHTIKYHSMPIPLRPVATVIHPRPKNQKGARSPHVSLCVSNAASITQLQLRSYIFLGDSTVRLAALDAKEAL
jgi:hypothetical protein